MHEASAFSLQALPPGNRGLPHQRLLVSADGQGGVRVDGDDLLRQYDCGDTFLVITCCDYLDGVSHWFHLVDRGGRVMDVVSTPDTFGFLQHDTVDAPHQISFGFFGSPLRWALDIDQAGHRSFGWGDVRIRPLRFAARRRHLRLRALG
jgi:hypothetical protein